MCVSVSERCPLPLPPTMVNVRCLACQVKYRVLSAKNNNLPECQAPIHAPKFPYRAPNPRKPRSYNRVSMRGSRW